MVAASGTTDDVYIIGREIGRQFRVSLHRSGSWRLSVEPIDASTGDVMPPVGGAVWSRPEPFAPGMTKAFAVFIPASAARVPITEDLDPQVRLYPVPVGAKALAFTVIYSEPGVPSRSWPGSDAMHTALVGTFTLPESLDTVSVVVDEIDQLPGSPPPMHGKLMPGTGVEDLRRVAEEGSLHGIAFGYGDDGTRWLMDFAAVPGDPDQHADLT